MSKERVSCPSLGEIQPFCIFVPCYGASMNIIHDFLVRHLCENLGQSSCKYHNTWYPYTQSLYHVDAFCEKWHIGYAKKGLTWNAYVQWHQWAEISCFSSKKRLVTVCAWSVCLIIRAEESCDLCFWCKKPCGGNRDWPIRNNTAIKLNFISTWSKILRLYCLHNNSIWPLLIMLCRCIIPVSSLYQVFFVQ